MKKIIEKYILELENLPEINKYALFLVEYKGQRFWDRGFICDGRVELDFLHQNCYAINNYISENGSKILNWFE